MSTISTAVGLDRISRVSGYNIKRGVFNNETQNLPQLIAILGEANDANQSGLTTDKVEITSAAQAGELFGYGSPIHAMMRILRPINGDGVGGIPTIVFPQISDGSNTVKIWTVTGTATANATHTVIINGRNNIDYQKYSFNVAVGDTATEVAAKIADAVNGVLAAPCIATLDGTDVIFTTKWSGDTSQRLNIRFDYLNNYSGMAFSQTGSVNGAGTIDISEALSQFGDDHYTMVLNPYGVDQLAVLEAFNGLPNDTNPTGRYNGLVFKPFCAYFGSTQYASEFLTDITDDAARISQVTNVLCPAPSSAGWNFEAAANVVALASVVFQNTPNLDVSNLAYPDMPVPLNGNIGDMSDYQNRDFLVKKGCSTVLLKNGAYVIQDLVTTYHPEGEVPLQYSYPRNLNLDWNIADSYKTLETLYLKDKTLVADGQLVDVDGCIKPSEWKGIVYDLFDGEAQKALINDPEFSKASLNVQISSTNPNRFETAFKYKRTGIARIESTTASAGF
jgi:phage tail sheath gpL-like